MSSKAFQYLLYRTLSMLLLLLSKKGAASLTQFDSIIPQQLCNLITHGTLLSGSLLAQEMLPVRHAMARTIACRGVNHFPLNCIPPRSDGESAQLNNSSPSRTTTHHLV